MKWMLLLSVSFGGPGSQYNKWWKIVFLRYIYFVFSFITGSRYKKKGENENKYGVYRIPGWENRWKKGFPV